MPRAETSQRRHYAKETVQPYGPRDSYVQPAYRSATLSPRQFDHAPGIPSLGSIPANPSSDHPEGTYALEPDETGSYQGFPSVAEFEEILDTYLKGLSQRKQEKALITQEMYDCIHAVLMDPTNTAYGTPQFRFWVRKMFVLACFQGEYTVTHEDKPVAAKEQIYQILVHCHGECYHGGRDKTCAQIKGYYSWIPKELVAQFVKACPTCVLKRSNNPKKFVAMLKDISGSHQGAEEQYIDYITSPLRNRGNGPSPRGSAGSSRSGGDNAQVGPSGGSSSSSKPDPRLFTQPVPPLLTYEAPSMHAQSSAATIAAPSLMQLAGSAMAHAGTPALFTPGALEEAKPMFRDGSASTNTTTSSLATMFSDSGYASSAVEQAQAQAWPGAAEAGAVGGFHLGVPNAADMHRGLARSAGADFMHPQQWIAAAANLQHVASPQDYFPISQTMVSCSSAPPSFVHTDPRQLAHHPTAIAADAYFDQSGRMFNPFHVTADPNAAIYLSQAHSPAAFDGTGGEDQDGEVLEQDGLPQIKLEAAPSPALDSIALPDPESPSPLPSRPILPGVRRLGAPASLDLSGTNFTDYRGTPALLSAVTVPGSVPQSATDAFFRATTPTTLVHPHSAGVAAYHHYGSLHHHHLQHHQQIPSAPATATTFGALDLSAGSRRSSVDDDFLVNVGTLSSGLDVLSYAAMDPTFAAAVLSAAAPTGPAIPHHQEVVVTRSSPSVVAPPPAAEVEDEDEDEDEEDEILEDEEDEGPDGEAIDDAASVLEVREDAKEAAHAVEQEFEDVFS